MTVAFMLYSSFLNLRFNELRFYSGNVLLLGSEAWKIRRCVCALNDDANADTSVAVR